MPESQASRYEAFISYSHVPTDAEQTNWLHRAIETYRTPKALVKAGAPRRTGKVFQDKQELEGAPSVRGSLLEKLRESKYLIVVCSPRSAKSEWVNREVEYFRGLGRGDRILTWLIEGAAREAFPPALTAPDEKGNAPDPLAADIRPLPPRFSLRGIFAWMAARLRFRARRRVELLRVLAPMLGCRFDDLRRREEVRARRRKWTAGSVAAAALAGFLVVNSLEQRIFELTVYSRDALQLDPSRGVVLARRADQMNRWAPGLAGPLVSETLEDAVYASRLRAQYQMPASPAQAVAWDRSGLIVAGDDRGNVREWNRVSGAVVETDFFDGGIQKIELQPSGNAALAMLLTGSVNRMPEGPTVVKTQPRTLRIWNLRTGANGAPYALSASGRIYPFPSDVAWCDGEHAAASDGLDSVAVWNPGNGTQSTLRNPAWVTVNAIKWAPGCGALELGTASGLYEWDAASGRIAKRGERCEPDLGPTFNASLTSAEGVIAIDVLPDGDGGTTLDRLATGDHTGVVCVGDTNPQPLNGHTGAITSVAWNHTGTRLATASLDGTVRIWTIPAERKLYRTEILLYTNQTQAWSVAWSPDDRELATSGGDGTVKVWNVDRAIEETLGGRRGVLGLDDEGRLTFDGRRVTSDELQELAARRSVRKLTRAECEAYVRRGCD